MVKRVQNYMFFVQNKQKSPNKRFSTKNIMHVQKMYMKSYPHRYAYFLAYLRVMH